eukprot:jgi/Tetstr1/446850/TSEL_034328.t1
MPRRRTALALVGLALCCLALAASAREDVNNPTAASVAGQAGGAAQATGLPRWNSTDTPIATTDPHEGEDPEDDIDSDDVTTLSALLGALVFFTGAAMANSAGVGGGAVFVPVFNLVMREDLKHSTALSQVSVTAGAVIAVLLNLRKRNPMLRERMLIEVEFVLLLMPAMLLGISIGVLFNVALEVWLQKLLMVTLYIYLSYVTTRKGVSLLKKELATKRARGAAEADSMAYQPLPAEPVPAAEPGAAGAAGGGARDATVGHQGEREEGAAEAPWASLPARLPESKAGAPWGAADGEAAEPPLKGPGAATWVALFGLWTLYFAFSLLHHTRPFCVRCSSPFWSLYGAMSVATLVITTGILLHLSRKHAPGADPLARMGLMREEERPLIGTAVDSDEDSQQIDWSARNLARCAVIMWAAGLMAGFMGIGGGMIMSPLLLTLNVHPQVTAATSSMMVLFSSSAASVQLALEGMIDPWLAVSFAALAMLSSATGIIVVRRVIQRFGTTSIIVLVLGAFIGTAALIILISGIMEFEVVDKSHFKMFYNICRSEVVSNAAGCFL